MAPSTAKGGKISTIKAAGQPAVDHIDQDVQVIVTDQGSPTARPRAQAARRKGHRELRPSAHRDMLADYYARALHGSYGSIRPSLLNEAPVAPAFRRNGFDASLISIAGSGLPAIITDVTTAEGKSRA
jgi:acyl-CoA hydrolase